MGLSERFFGISSDSNDVSWDQYHQVFYDNKSAFEYNMSRIQTLETSIAKLQAWHKFLEVKEKIPNKQMDYITVYTLQMELM